MKAKWQAVRQQLRSGFWAIPAFSIVAAILLAIFLVQVDRALGEASRPWTFGAGPDGAREVLSGITSAMITFTALVFTITIVVLQLTSSQFSPRVLRTFLSDRITQVALAVFTSTFVYTMTVLRTVDGSNGQTFVPAVATTVALLILLVAVFVFILYIHHIATKIQVSSIINEIAKDTEKAVDRRYPPGSGHAPDAELLRPVAQLPDAVIANESPGVITSRNEAHLVRLASEAGVVLRTDLQMGAYVPHGAPLLGVHGDPERLDVKAARGAIRTALNRTMDEDPAFGFRQLVDVAERALSPGTNDPTTAVQVLDQLHNLLRRLATRPLRTGLHVDDAGELRLVVPAESFEHYLALALDEIDHYGAQSLQVQQRIDVLLEDLAEAALPEHAPAVHARRARRRSRQHAA